MKVIVKETFKDKVTGRICEVGTIIDVSKARYREITAKGDFIEKINPDKPAEEKGKNK